MVTSTSPLRSTDIRNRRIMMKLKQKDISALTDISNSELCKYERGLIMPSKKKILQLSKVLSIPAEDLHSSQKFFVDNPLSGQGYVTNKTHKPYVRKRKYKINKNKISVLDLFCGVGGLSHGFEQTNKFQVIAGLDLMPDRIETFAQNHPSADSYCYDIFKFPLNKFVKDGINPDVIVGGPPCQGFSSIRPFRSINENDARNDLLEYYALTVNKLKPKWFVLENVVGLLTHKNGTNVQHICKIFENIGYTISVFVLNGVHFGLPQRRERLFIIGNLENISFKFPVPTHYYSSKSMVKNNHYIHKKIKKDLKSAVTTMDAIGDLPIIKAGESSTIYPKCDNISNYGRKFRTKSKYLTLHKSTSHSKKMLEIIKHSSSNIKSIPKELVKSGFSTSYSRLDGSEPSVTITVNFGNPGSNRCIHPHQNRALTPREAARLQGFQDSFTFVGNRNNISKQIGNAVPPILGNVIAKAIFDQSQIFDN